MPPSLANRPEVKRLVRIFASKPLKLSDYHLAGEQLRRLQDDPELAQQIDGWKGVVAEIVWQSEATLNKCLQLRRAYEQEDLPELEQLGVGWGRVTIALAVLDRKKRHQLLQKAKKAGWTDLEMRREMQRLRGRRRGGGRTRKPFRSHGLLVDVGEMSRLTEVWNDFSDRVLAEMQQAYLVELVKMSAGVREAVRKQVEHALEQLERLQERAERARKALEMIRKRAGHGGKR
jgi:hypothetical protein